MARAALRARTATCASTERVMFIASSSPSHRAFAHRIPAIPFVAPGFVKRKSCPRRLGRFAGSCRKVETVGRSAIFVSMTLHIDAWLHGIGLAQYGELFRSNDIDGAMLRQLSADDLKELGVASLGHRKKLLEVIAALGAAPESLATIRFGSSGSR